MSTESNNWLLLLGALILVGGGGVALYGMTRGIRNNNPLNIEDNGTNWDGLDTPRNDGSTYGDGVPKLRFTSPEYGFRAAARTVTNYIGTDGVAPTINGIIRRWSATDQDAYVAHVANDMGVDPDATLSLPADLVPMFASMTSMENGGINPYSDATIQTGVSMA